MSATVGTPAPDFKLPSTPGEFVTLSELKGKSVVLLFYPAAFTSVCTKEMCAVGEDFSAYESLNATVLAISVDMPWAAQKFKAETGAPFAFLSDFNKEVIAAYGVVRHGFAFGLRDVAERAVFVIDAEGTIRYRWVGENPGIFPDLGAVKAALAG
ncbi:MAG: peroxiredoxin [Myxococcales bacterium]|nr:peroxiredoxin [Myxococcales bacterium]